MAAEEWEDDRTRREKAALIDTTAPNAARVADYLHGGRNNFEADRKVVRGMVAAAPVMADIVPAAHGFHRRAVRYLVAEVGVRQFLDVGTSLAAIGNTHEIAQSIDPKCRVVYVDSDPVVLTHARALTTSAPGGATAYLDADASHPEAIVAGARATLDLRRPVAVMLLGTSWLSFIDDTAAAAAVVSALLAALPPGSHVALTHPASDLDPALPLAIRRWNKESSQPITLRSRAEVTTLVAGLDLVPPGVAPVNYWHPGPDDQRFAAAVPVYAAVARKP